MNVKTIWTNSDFNNMSWHDCNIYNIAFPNDELLLILDIDYIFKWDLDKISNSYDFWVSPCKLKFYDVLNLNVSLEFKNNIGLNILGIEKLNPRLSPNKKVTLWDFILTLDMGKITFESSGYELNVIKQPIFTHKQILNRMDTNNKIHL